MILRAKIPGETLDHGPRRRRGRGGRGVLGRQRVAGACAIFHAVEAEAQCWLRAAGDARRAAHGASSVTETISWGVLYYVFAAILPAMERELFNQEFLQDRFNRYMSYELVANPQMAPDPDHPGTQAMESMIAALQREAAAALTRYMRSAAGGGVLGNLVKSPPAPARIPQAVGDIEGVPYLSETGRDAYRRFLERESPRAFALSSDGSYAWRSGSSDAAKAAMDQCNARATDFPCKVYAHDDRVVYRLD